MTINPFNVSYADFQLDQIINPDEFDVNFADIGIRINQLIDVVNHITDGTLESSGADIINIRDVLPFVSTNLQDFLQEFVDHLQNGTGAEFIGSLPVAGVDGTTVQAQLMSLGTLLTQLRTDLDNEVVRVTDLIARHDTEVHALDQRVTANETALTNVDLNKADRGESYTKLEADMIAGDLEDGIYANVYTKEDTDLLLGTKTDVTGNHEGTWKGLELQDLANAIYVKGMVIDTVRPATPSEGLLWFNPDKDEYQIYLNGRWRVNGGRMRIEEVHNRVVLDVDSTTVNIGIPTFDPRFDAVIVAQNSVFIAKDYEYTLSADGTTITNLETDELGAVIPWRAGTVFDFTAHIATPITE